MKKTTLILAGIFLAGPVRAEFEGILHMKMSGKNINGIAKTYISKNGTRQEMTMQGPHGPANITTLTNAKHPNIAVVLNDQTHTYAEINTNEAKQMAGKTSGEKFIVKSLGDDAVAGYSCKHVLVIGERSGETELWTTRELMGYSDYSKLQARDREHGEMPSYIQALKDAKADGFPVKSVHRSHHGETITVELTKVEKTALPASLFEIPAGYRKSEGMGPQGMGAAPGGGIPPHVRQQMEQQMRNLPPEQQEMMKKMMEQRR